MFDTPELFPVLSPHDYAAFRDILNDHIPHAYDEWFNLQTNEIRQFEQAGRKVLRIPINPYEFTRYLHSRGAVANTVTLRDCAVEKAAKGGH